MNLRRSILSLLVVSIATVHTLSGCSDDESPTPGADTDAGTQLDSGTTTDSGVTPDSGSTPDSGGEPDSGTTPDAGGEPDSGTTPDAGIEPDAGTTPDAGIEPDAGTTLDAGIEPDAGTTADAGPGTPPFTECEGDCKKTAVTIELKGNSRVLTSAYFGYEEPKDPTAPWELWIELNNGKPGECPTEDSALPPQLVNVYKVTVPVDTKPQTGISADEPRATLVDFEGALTTAYFLHSTKLTFTPAAASLCTSCAKEGKPPASHFVAFDVNGVYADGSLLGHAYATYCPSLDKFQK
ncbi:hypothetical protein MYSTI_02190 [Myxococcus stipitatus DSM 14675]|uniref:Lipoprotein n=1 Tax=Myxococcus stipitatus (strain DSM 14675 / JCM 12634 / Mx s8) TaxID=1278073 RepID=L7U7H5_MYXSD|nr:hypothetical protein [Myxococcus stipitatus]AGC43517.1 hypothetical protein MYSTI_02190 [Myxococcus stipitatus DSM 14675]